MKDRLLHELKYYHIETFYHSIRVASLSVRMAKHMLYPEERLEALYHGALLHDIGKLKIEEAILNKPGKLTNDEWCMIMKHPIIGYEILKKYDFNSDVKSVVLFHHERCDGSGYPFQLEDSQIPLNAKIVAVADSFDAMTHHRVYSRAKSIRKALEELNGQKGLKYDSKVVDTLQQILPPY
ncbi:HD-GYP domain-containing protein [Microaerobacter geothermalis]|uniref:HD-GYP domain-containing protein n=1 Tax=Microaerobacter geothermalis TaxID=674972 RepID=UPI001F32836F|nr:HD-GYP domain-containing protein [Microaerobacter geothermalis]MCF6093410.1 HD-GYP domain-containing protein [Microaerobacter geothermalis]